MRTQAGYGTLCKLYPALTPSLVIFRSAALGLVLLTCWQRLSQYSFKICILKKIFEMQILNESFYTAGGFMLINGLSTIRFYVDMLEWHLPSFL